MKNQTRIAAAAVALVQAERAVDKAKGEYSSALSTYFSNQGRPEGPMTADDPRFASARRATEAEYGEVQRLKGRFRRARRKLHREVNRAGGAES